MKQILSFFFLAVFSISTNAQSFKGVYAGTIFSEKNIVVLRDKGKIIDGTLYLNKDELFVLVGTIKDSELVGTMTFGTGACSFKANLAADSLQFSLTCENEMKVAYLKKISSNPNKNISKLLESLAKDERLIGNWVLRRVENLDGSPKKIGQEMTGMTYIISGDGSLYINIPSLYNKIKNSGFSPPQQTWATHGPELTITNAYKSSTCEYEIMGDTLIMKPKTEISYWVKTK